MASAKADYCQAGYSVADALTSSGKESGWALDQPGLPHAAVFVLAKPLGFNAPGRLAIRLQQRAGESHQLLRFRVTLTDGKPEDALQQALPDEIRHLAAKSVQQRSQKEQALLKRYYESVYTPNSPRLAAWNSALATYAQYIGATAAHTIRERVPKRETFLHVRGDFRRPGERVEPGFLSALPNFQPHSEKSSAPQQLTRLDLARWIVDPKNPLAARVAVNDLWQHLFGNGLVRTPGDFGRQGDVPTHPELLDYLADEFVAKKWSRKAMIREIACSSTYRQSSVTRPDLREHDPRNALLARQNRLRLDADALPR